MSTLVTESTLTRGRNWQLMLVIFAAAILLTRLPSLIGNPHLPDGDEALIGVMAQHVAQGESIPLFPWGQRYGLATPEVLLAAAGFKVFGESLLVLRGAVLLEWGIGALLFMAAVRRIGWPSAAIWVGAMLISCPGWLGMSIRASATFVTGFFFSGVALYAMSRLVGWQSSIGLSPGLSAASENAPPPAAGSMDLP